MRRVRSLAAAVLVGVAAMIAVTPPASAKTKAKVEWVRVDVPEGQDAARRAKLFKEALKQAVKRADFGKTEGKVALSARIAEMRVERRGDVLQITCSVMGRVQGGAGAKSKISYGGSPDNREQLEKDVLTMVANGLVARLAQIVRTQPPKVR